MMGNKTRLGGQEQDPRTEQNPGGQDERQGETKPAEPTEADKGEKVDGRRDADHPILPNPD